MPPKCNKVSILFSVWFRFGLVLLLSIGFTPPLLISAQTEPTSLGLSVSPQIFELDVFPGEKHLKKINLGNLSEVAMPILVRVTDFTVAEETGEMLFDESSQDPSFASRFWFEIEKPNFILEPKEKREVRFSINIPENAEPGGHYAVILFEPQLPSFYFQKGQIPAIPVVGVLFLISVKTLSLEPETGEKLQVVEFSLPKEERMAALENLFSKLIASSGDLFSAKAQVATEITITKKFPQNFILRIKNNDIYHTKPFGKVLIYNWFGKKVGETEVPKMTILPGKTRAFPVEFSPEIPEKLKWLPASISEFLVQNTSLGKYKAVVALEIPSQKLETETQFWALSWRIFLPSLFLIIGLILIRRRIVAATKALLDVRH